MKLVYSIVYAPIKLVDSIVSLDSLYTVANPLFFSCMVSSERAGDR